MSVRSSEVSARFGKHLAFASATMLALMIATPCAWSQRAPSAEPQAPQAPAPQAPPEQTAPSAPSAPAAEPPPRENPGLINEIGKMIDKLPGLKSTGETIEDLNARAKDAAKGATDTLSRMTTSSMVTGRMICPISGNGAPDCKTASDKLCQTKNFKEGKSLLTDSAETCSPKVLIPGRARKPDDCRTDTYVTRALCQ
jgi:hypothetical protein